MRAPPDSDERSQRLTGIGGIGNVEPVADKPRADGDPAVDQKDNDGERSARSPVATRVERVCRVLRLAARWRNRPRPSRLPMTGHASYRVHIAANRTRGKLRRHDVALHLDPLEQPQHGEHRGRQQQRLGHRCCVEIEQVRIEDQQRGADARADTRARHAQDQPRRRVAGDGETGDRDE